RSLLKTDACSGPATDIEIIDAERELGVRFPLSYRIFMRHFGAAWLNAPYEIAGLSPHRATGPETPQWSHVIDATVSIRRVARGHIPDAYVLISDDGGDYKFYLDTSRVDERGESPVLALGPGVDGREVAASFLEFVEKVAF